MKVHFSRSVLALSLLVTAVAAAQATDLTVTLNSSVDLENAVFAYKGPNDESGAPLGTIPAGSYTAVASIAGDYAEYQYTLLSTYHSAVDGHEGVVVGLNAAATSTAMTSSFETMFGTSESSIATAIKGIYSSNPVTQYLSLMSLENFANANLSKFPVGLTGGSLVGFSNGTNLGTVVAAPVPEPTAMAVLGLGLVGVSRRRKK